METRKNIQTNCFYGREPRILWIYNQPISEEFPKLFEGFWDVYEAWYYHGEQVEGGLSSFLFDAKLSLAEQHWKRERFGNYLYGAFISIYFSWNYLQVVKAKRNTGEIQDDLALILQVNGIVRYLFTALDALACCIYIAEDEIPSGFQQVQVEFHRISIKTIKRKIKDGSAYGSLGSLVNRAEFKYLTEYRNLLTHRPFPQFSIDSSGYHFPERLDQLDSITQRAQQYLQPDVGSYLGSAFTVIEADLEASLPELGARYRSRI
jgi:hypothetical protein